MVPGYCVSDRPEDMDLQSIHNFISETYWAEDIPLETMSKAMENSLCFGVFEDGGSQVGFARIITDHVTFAYLCDVYIEEAHRGKGLAKWLMQFVHSHSSLNGLRRIVLVTRDAHSLYQQFGYTELNNPVGYMEKWEPHVYKKA